MSIVISQWALPLLMYFLVVATRVHEIIRVMPCHTVMTGIIMTLAGPAFLLGPGYGPLANNIWTLFAWVMLCIIMYVMAPLLLSSGPWRSRLYMVVHLASIFLIAHLLVLVLNHIRGAIGHISSTPPMDQMCTCVMEIGFILVLCQCTDRFALRIIPRADKKSFDPFLFFSALQCFMIGTSVIVISLRGVTEPVFLSLTFLLASLCLLTDISLGAVIWRAQDMREKQHEADAKQAVLDSYLDSTDALIRHAETMAKHRHDARNQLAVIQLLAKRGATQEALRHVKELRAACAEELRP